MSRFEVTFSSADPELAAQLAEIDKLPPLEKDEVLGALMVHLGVLWQTKAARIRGRSSAFNRRARLVAAGGDEKQ